MEVHSIQVSHTNFQAKVAPELENSIRKFYNTGENRLKNMYRVDEKIRQYKKFGFKTHTVNFSRKDLGYGVEYKLYALKDGLDEKQRIVIAKCNSFKQLVKSFMDINKQAFYRKVKHK